jgi:xanthine dehydrogenase YagT iron-sulfur-binding subunit
MSRPPDPEPGRVPDLDTGADPGDARSEAGLSRRRFLGHAVTVSAGVTVGGQLGAAGPAGAEPAQEAAAAGGAQLVDVALRVNGRPVRLRIDPRMTLLDALRERLDLTGSKKGCDHGQCGACTVHVDGRRVLGCLTLAAAVRGRSVTTIEGLARGDDLHPMQQAFVDCDAFQCGFCTPGQIMSAVALVREGRAGSPAEIREFMSGNICRCGAYPNIVRAVQTVADGRDG